MLRVQLHGHLNASFGLAGGAKATGRLLTAAGCEVIPSNLHLASHTAIEPEGAIPRSSKDPVQLDLVHTNPNILQASPELLQTNALKAPLRIGYWAWELEAFPQGWEQFFSDYDEIWCPSPFTAQSLAQRSPIPVVSIPHLPNWPRLNAIYQQRVLHKRTTERPKTRFLCCFDYWSTMARKNPQGTITAFQQAFPIHRQDVELVIKTSNANQFQAQHHQLKTSCANDNRIQWVDQLLSPIAMDQLLVSADVFVSLHRAEGFGLILADAMALGIPVIATGYSGNLEFMPPGSAALVPWQWSVIETNQGDYRKGNRWGEPSLGHAAKAMADLADSAQQRSQLGEAGRRAALERLSEQRLVPLVQQRLGTLLQHPSRRELEPPQPLG